MQRFVIRGTVLGAVVLAGLVTPVPAHASDPYAPAYNPPPTVTSVNRPNPALVQVVQFSQATHVLTAGTVTLDGAPVVGLDVVAEIEPARQLTAAAPEGAAYELVRLAQGTTDLHGGFELRVPFLTNLSGYQDSDDGSVSVLLSGFNQDVGVYHRLQLVPPTTETRGWAFAIVDDLVSVSPTSPVHESVNKGTECIAAQLEQDYCLFKPDDPLGSLSILAHRRDAAFAAGVDGRRYCEYSHYWARSDKNVIYSPVKVQRVKTLGRTNVRYEWKNTKQTSTDAAANIGYRGSLVAAGYTKTQSTSAGINYGVGANRSWDLRAEYDWRPYYLYCINPYTAMSRYAGVYEWRPFRWAGGNDAVDVGTFTCSGYRTKISFEIWVARNRSNGWTGGASFGGISLRSSQYNSDEHRMYIKPLSAPAALCGYDDVVTSARLVREIPLY